MRTRTFDMTIFDEAGNDYNITVTAEYYPAERGTRNYPGCPAWAEIDEITFEDGVERPELVKENEDRIIEEAMEQFEGR